MWGNLTVRIDLTSNLRELLIELKIEGIQKLFIDDQTNVMEMRSYMKDASLQSQPSMKKILKVLNYMSALKIQQTKALIKSQSIDKFSAIVVWKDGKLTKISSCQVLTRSIEVEALLNKQSLTKLTDLGKDNFVRIKNGFPVLNLQNSKINWDRLQMWMNQHVGSA